MKIFFKFVLILFALLFCADANNIEKEYKTTMVSSEVIQTRTIYTSNQDVLKANVMIFNSNYSSFFGLRYKQNNSYGSGVIYKSDANYYYALTNNHVVDYRYTYNENKLYVEDYYSNRYEAEVIYSDASYDLAIIRFSKGTELKVLDISNESGKVRESVRSMGNPSSIKNVLNKGMINCYSYITLDSDKSNVDFEVIVHSAEIAGGSSGGALLNNYNEIIGITFAGVFDDVGNFITGYAIPREKIVEFLNKSFE